MCSNIIAQTNLKTLREIKNEMKSINNSNAGSANIFVQDNITSHKYSFIKLADK